MATGLTITAIVAMITSSTPALVQAILGNGILFFGLLIVELVMVWYLAAEVEKMSVPAATATFIGYSALNGLTLSLIFLLYIATSIASTFAITAGTFAVMSIYGYTTKRDLTSFGSLLFMGLIGIIIASIINMFFFNQTVYWIITYIGILIFVGLTAYDTQRMKNMAMLGAEGTLEFRKEAIIGALALYLDFINLFLLLLRLNRQK